MPTDEEIKKLYPLMNGNGDVTIQWNDRAMVAREAFKSALQYAKPVWVKASQRLPGNDGYYNGKFSYIPVQIDITKGQILLSGTAKPFNKETDLEYLEWLDESALQYSVGDVAVKFLDSIRDYERENGQRICFDERTSEELFNEFINK